MELFGQLNIYIFLKINLFVCLFIYFWLRWVFIAARGLSPAVASGGHSSPWCVGLTLRCLLQSTGSRRTGPSGCGMQAQQLGLADCRAQAQ